MRDIIRDASVDADRHLGILEVWYPDESEWDTAAYVLGYNFALNTIYC